MSIISYCAFVPLNASAHITALARRQGNAAFGYATIIILDMSGSMQQNDPNGLRCSATNAYIDLSSSTDRIGLIGLDNNDGTTENTHNFLAAQTWANPTIVGDPRTLQDTIAQKSQHCKPDGSTPTYDALQQALSMLDTATKKDHLQGSVILLTDGAPYPDCDDIEHNNCAQAQYIESELLPKFQTRKWPIDTIALGNEVAFRKFLNVVSNSTQGKFYDDANGVVPGVSPLNITPFFVDIFARHHHLLTGPSVAPTIINAESTSQPFVIDTHVAYLDIIVVKVPADNDSTKMPVTLSTPDPRIPVLPPKEPIPGVFSYTGDPYFAFFSVKGPQKGDWCLNIHGSGQFTLVSLFASNLQASITEPSNSNTILPLGKDFVIAAMIEDQQRPVSDGNFSVTATVEYNGMVAKGASSPIQSVPLLQQKEMGLYSGHATIPLNAPSGAYTVTVLVSEVSDAPIASAAMTITMAMLPQPNLNAVQIKSIQFDPIFQLVRPLVEYVYSMPLPPLTTLHQWLLSQSLEQSPLTLSGTMQQHGMQLLHAYMRHKSQNIELATMSDRKGRFSVLLPALEDGNDDLILTTKEVAYDNSKHPLGISEVQSTYTLSFVHTSANWGQEVVGWLKLLIPVLLCIYLFWFFTTPFPFGAWVRVGNNNSTEEYSFRRWWRLPLQLFFHRNILSSAQANMPRGMQIRFRRGWFKHKRRIQVRSHGMGRKSWRMEDGKDLPRRFTVISNLMYVPDKKISENVPPSRKYVIFPDKSPRG